ncbi:hypothetical protein BC831DRAFT_512568 [Entophlyctis helioformis]|nr:hypothetical protein BC831DRAFT_512568 [Entophlyctis helioformis]
MADMQTPEVMEALSPIREQQSASQELPSSGLPGGGASQDAQFPRPLSQADADPLTPTGGLPTLPAHAQTNGDGNADSPSDAPDGAEAAAEGHEQADTSMAPPLPQVPEVIKFQLIPVSDQADRPAVGDVIERSLKEGQCLRIGRQVVRDGQPAAPPKGKAPTDVDVWFSSKVVSRTHAEMWAKDSQIYIKDIGSSSGTFLNKMRLSPAGKESRPYPLKEGDLIQLGVDYKGKTDADVYRSVSLKIGFHDQAWIHTQRRKANPARFATALKALLAATNPYGTTQAGDDDNGATDCCICIGPIGPFQALFIAPCSHCYHYKCVASIVMRSPMFQCPLCRQVANLTASVSSDSLHEKVPGFAASSAVAVMAGDAKNSMDLGASASSQTSQAHAQVGRMLAVVGGQAVGDSGGGGGGGSSDDHEAHGGSHVDSAMAQLMGVGLNNSSGGGRGMSKSPSHSAGGFFSSIRRPSLLQSQQQAGAAGSAAGGPSTGASGDGGGNHGANAAAAGGANASGGDAGGGGKSRRKSFTAKAEQIFESFKFSGRKQSVDHSNRRQSVDIMGGGANAPSEQGEGAIGEASGSGSASGISSAQGDGGVDKRSNTKQRRTISMKIGSFLKNSPSGDVRSTVQGGESSLQGQQGQQLQQSSSRPRDLDRNALPALPDKVQQPQQEVQDAPSQGVRGVITADQAHALGIHGAEHADEAGQMSDDVNQPLPTVAAADDQYDSDEEDQPEQDGAADSGEVDSEDDGNPTSESSMKRNATYTVQYDGDGLADVLARGEGDARVAGAGASRVPRTATDPPFLRSRQEAIPEADSRMQSELIDTRAFVAGSE